MDNKFSLAIYKIIIENKKDTNLDQDAIEKLQNLIKNTNISKYERFFILLILYAFSQNRDIYKEILLKQYKSPFNLNLKSRYLDTVKCKNIAVGQSMDGAFGHHRKIKVSPLLEALGLSKDDILGYDKFIWKYSLNDLTKFFYNTTSKKRVQRYIS